MSYLFTLMDPSQVAFMAQHTFYQSHTFHMRGVGGKVPI